MEERKEFIDGLAKYVQDIIYHMDNIDDPFYGDFEASYHKDDLIAVYKIIRMRKLNIIDNKEYYRLMNLYYEYLVLEGRINYISFMEYKGITDEAYFEINETTKDELYERLRKVQSELNKYQLMPCYIETIYHMDYSIKHCLNLNKRCS